MGRPRPAVRGLHWHRLDSVPSPGPGQRKYLCAGVPKGGYSVRLLGAKTEIPVYYFRDQQGLQVGLPRTPAPCRPVVGGSQSHADGAAGHGVAAAFHAAIVGQAVGSVSRGSPKISIRVGHRGPGSRSGGPRCGALRGRTQSRQVKERGSRTLRG